MLESTFFFLGQVVAFWTVWKILDHTVVPVVKLLKPKPRLPDDNDDNVLPIMWIPTRQTNSYGPR